MEESIRTLEPKELWNKFADLNAVPRPSKKEDRVIEFMKQFGNRLGLETRVDHIGNVVIKKPATPGMEDRKPVILQAHLDMVHQKNNNTNFDFDTQGIEMYIDGDWVRARGTTLGADNGLGVASIMAILESTEIPHPEIEGLFTVDEETGMTGAKGLEPGSLKGEILLNLDTEEDDEIGIGCAGGVDVTATAQYPEKQTPRESAAFRITLGGLRGGHSGMDILKGLGNANKMMNRVLRGLFDTTGASVSSIEGGGLRNAIPRESESIVTVRNADLEVFLKTFDNIHQELQGEYGTLEPGLRITCEETEVPQKVMDQIAQQKLLQTISGTHNGVYRMSPEIEGLVEASNNLAKVTVGNGKIEIRCLTRSSVESSKHDLAASLSAVFDLAEFQVELSGDYPGWSPDRNSEVLQVVDQLYQELHGERAQIAACHAGLECGIIGDHFPQLDMISFGPTIRGAHSPDERASISSAQKYWNFLLKVLENIPQRDRKKAA